MRKTAVAFLGAVMMAWYLAAGIQIDNYGDALEKAKCPGHRTARDAMPWIRVLTVPSWPIGVGANVFAELTPSEWLVCDRFDQ